MVGNDLQVTGAASVQGNIIVNGATARVGIRTNSPSQALDVIGSAEVSVVKFSGGKIETLGYNDANNLANMV